VSLEAKVMELGRAVLGSDVVLCVDAEHVLDRVMERIETKGAPQGVASDVVKEIESACSQIYVLESEASSITCRLDEILRKLGPPKPKAVAS